MKRILCFVIILSSLFCIPAYAVEPLRDDDIDISAPSAVLMEKQTGSILYDKNAHERFFPASITKIMTMLLITEALERGQISLDGTVTASSNAASFGGSCVYLESGEQMSVSDMLKCIAVVSANDCAVAMSEYISGSEEKFVQRMNERALTLGLEDTHFTNCTGLFDDSEHYTTAADVAVMSRELIGHELIKDYTTIWMDSIRGGEFELSNTNKLVYWYPGCTGLKTGYTSSAMYCLSATAEREGVEYIAVVMHAESSEARNRDAEALLEFAFRSFALCPLRNGETLPEVSVELGKRKRVRAEYVGNEYAVIRRGSALEPEFNLQLAGSVRAPVRAGDRLGSMTVTLGGETVAEIPLCAVEDVPRIGFFGMFRLLAGTLFGM